MDHQMEPCGPTVCQYKGHENKASLFESLLSYLTLPISNIMSKYGARAIVSRCLASILQTLDSGARRCSQDKSKTKTA